MSLVSKRTKPQKRLIGDENPLSKEFLSSEIEYPVNILNAFCILYSNPQCHRWFVYVKSIEDRCPNMKARVIGAHSLSPADPSEGGIHEARSKSCIGLIVETPDLLFDWLKQPLTFQLMSEKAKTDTRLGRWLPKCYDFPLRRDREGRVIRAMGWCPRKTLRLVNYMMLVLMMFELSPHVSAYQHVMCLFQRRADSRKFYTFTLRQIIPKELEWGEHAFMQAYKDVMTALFVENRLHVQGRDLNPVDIIMSGFTEYPFSPEDSSIMAESLEMKMAHCSKKTQLIVYEPAIQNQPPPPHPLPPLPPPHPFLPDLNELERQTTTHFHLPLLPLPPVPSGDSKNIAAATTLVSMANATNNTTESVAKAKAAAINMHVVNQMSGSTKRPRMIETKSNPDPNPDPNPEPNPDPKRMKTNQEPQDPLPSQQLLPSLPPELLQKLCDVLDDVDMSKTVIM